SDMLNFSNQSTFGKFFKKHTGQSPAEFRKGKQ
ncbi:helix-turn-helix domain-containing protein, partial [Macellibacteroides fermentans]|nr:AraC family transcriptional regulator [Macellibacteroides fermentans]